MDNNLTGKHIDPTIVLTGGTGNLGRFLVPKLLALSNARLILLVRAQSNEEARKRVSGIIRIEDRRRVTVLRSDLSDECLGLSSSDFSSIAKSVTHILHSAASVRFTLPLAQARAYNVSTVEHMLQFAKKCENLVRFGFIGTALVAGNRTGIIREDEFEHDAGFKNTYEQSKYEAELVVRTHSKDLPIVIFRPPLIAPAMHANAHGHNHINALVLGSGLVARRDVTFLPGTEKSVVDVVSPEIAVETIVKLFLKPRLSHFVYHITNGTHPPTVETIKSLIENKIGRILPIRFCGSAAEYSASVSKIPWYKFSARYAHQKIASFILELAYPKIYDNRCTLSELDMSYLSADSAKVIEDLLK